MGKSTLGIRRILEQPVQERSAPLPLRRDRDARARVRDAGGHDDILAKLAEEFGDGEAAGRQASTRTARSSTRRAKHETSHHYGYGSRYRDANTSDAVQLFSSRRRLGKVMDITATLGHAGLNWTPKRHGTVSPLAERIKVALL